MDTEQTYRLKGVHVKYGTIDSNDVAAFDFDNTLAWSDSGLIYMRTVFDWVAPSGYETLHNFLQTLKKDRWTVVIFINQLERNPQFTQTALDRLDNFLAKFFPDTNWRPTVFTSTLDDENRKPKIGMWNLFLDTAKQTKPGFQPSSASFYCGDAVGPNAINPIYRWSDSDSQFAQNCGLTFYDPDELIGRYIPPEINPQTHEILLIMAAHPSQYAEVLTRLGTIYARAEGIENAATHIKYGWPVIITGERLATRAGRRRMMHLIPKEQHANTYILMFTRPIKPFVTDQEYRADDMAIRGYANALDYHPSQHYPHENDKLTAEPFPILRIN